MSVADSLESFLLHAEARAGQKTVELKAKLKKKAREGRTFLFSLSKGLESKKEEK